MTFASKGITIDLASGHLFRLRPNGQATVAMHGRRGLSEAEVTASPGVYWTERVHAASVRTTTMSPNARAVQTQPILCSFRSPLISMPMRVFRHMHKRFWIPTAS